MMPLAPGANFSSSHPRSPNAGQRLHLRNAIAPSPKKTTSTSENVGAGGCVLLLLAGAVWLFGGFQCQKKPNAADLKQQADSAAFDQHHQQWEPWRKKALLKHWQVEAANGNTYLAEALESIDQLCKRASVQHRVNISLEDVLDGLEYEEILDEHIEAQRIMHSTDQAGELKDWLEWHPMK